MSEQLKPTEPCPWPLDCCPEALAGKPAHADCPREASTWLRVVNEAGTKAPGTDERVPLGDIVRPGIHLA